MNFLQLYGERGTANSWKKVVFPDVKLEASYENGEQPYEEDINPCLKLAMLIHKN